MKYVVIALLILTLADLNGQAVIKDEVYLGIDAGFGGQFYLSEFGDDLPFTSVSYQKCFKNNWSSTIKLGYGTATSPNYSIINEKYYIKYEYILANIQLKYHFIISDNGSFDGYFGSGLFAYFGKGNLNFIESTNNIQANYSNEIDYNVSAFGGMRYWIAPRFAIYGEFAYRTLYSSFGLVYHLK